MGPFMKPHGRQRFVVLQWVVLLDLLLVVFDGSNGGQVLMPVAEARKSVRTPGDGLECGGGKGTCACLAKKF